MYSNTLTKEIQKIIEYYNLNLTVEEFKDKTKQDDWKRISQYQTLSDEFIEEFKPNLDWYNVFKNKKLNNNTDIYNENFKKWFGNWNNTNNPNNNNNTNNTNNNTNTNNTNNNTNNSKVVDQNGKPMIMYHGTDYVFQQFDENKIGEHGRAIGAGFYFTSDKSIAEGYTTTGNVKKVYLNIKKPLKYNAPPFNKNVIKKILTYIAEWERDNHNIDIKDGFLADFEDTYYHNINTVLNAATNLLYNEKTALEQLGGIIGAGIKPFVVNKALYNVTGYDGFVEDGKNGKDGVVFIALFPQQIMEIN